MYKKLSDVIKDTGVCRLQILRHCYKGNVRFVNIGFSTDNTLVEEDDVKELKVKGEL